MLCDLQMVLSKIPDDFTYVWDIEKQGKGTKPNKSKL